MGFIIILYVTEIEYDTLWPSYLLNLFSLYGFLVENKAM